MIQVSLLNLYASLPSERGTAEKRTPRDMGQSLFRALLKREAERSSTRERYGVQRDGRAREQLSSRSLRKEESDHWPGEGMDALGRDLLLPPDARKELLAYLKAIGLSEKKAMSLVSGATDGKGRIHLDRLAAALQDHERSDEDGRSGFLVPRDQVRQFEVILFRMGLGAEDVRRLEEEALTARGDFALKPVATYLGAYSPGLGEEKALSALLGRFGIHCVRPEQNLNLEAGELRSLLAHYLSRPDSSARDQAKREIAAALREKGLGPEEVRSFLDRLTVKYARLVLESTDSGDPQEARRAREALMERVILEEREGLNEKGLKARAMDSVSRKTSGNSAGRYAFGNGPLKGEAGSESESMMEKLNNLEKRIRKSAAPGRSARTGAARAETSVHRTGKPGREPSMNPSLAQTGPANPSSGIDTSSREPQTGRPVPLPQLVPTMVDRMRWMLRAGRHTSRLELNPPELGRLDLEVVLDRGVLRAHIGAENLAVKHLIESNLGQLRDQLSQLGVTVEKFDVMVGLANKDFGDRPQGRLGKKGGKVFHLGGSNESLDGPAPAETGLSLWRGARRLLSVQV